MAKTWFTSDWHLGESRMQVMCRPFFDNEKGSATMNMIETIRNNHNSMVAEDDIVYVIGDCCNKNTPEFLDYADQFNGVKILIRGNHDVSLSDEDFLKVFEEVIPEGKGVDLDLNGLSVYLTHYPTQSKSDVFNLVGHIHGAWKVQLNMLNVGVDAHHFRPISADDVAFYYKAICEFYDRDVFVAYHEVNASYRDIRSKQSSYFT